MNCKYTSERLPWFANGTLGPDEHQQVRRHLIRCRACRAENRALAGQLSLLADLRRTQKRAVEIAVEIESHESSGWQLGTVVPIQWVSRSVRLAAALVLAFVLGSVLNPQQYLNHSEDPKLVTAQSQDAQQDAQRLQPVFDEGFESGSLSSWRVSSTLSEDPIEPESESNI